MKNLQYIREMKIEDLAELLIREKEIDEGGEGSDGEYRSLYITHYVSPDGSHHYSYEESIETTINWLNSEYTEINV